MLICKSAEVGKMVHLIHVTPQWLTGLPELMVVLKLYLFYV